MKVVFVLKFDETQKCKLQNIASVFHTKKAYLTWKVHYAYLTIKLTLHWGIKQFNVLLVHMLLKATVTL